MAETMLETARRYIAAGLSVIPIAPGGKEPWHHLLEQTTGLTVNWVASDPRAPWRVYCERMPTDAELITWFADGRADIGIVGGQISGGLVRIDFEHRDCLHVWLDELKRSDDPALAIAARELPLVETSKGHHVYLRMPDPPGHVLLSSWGTGKDMLVFAETQGQGCYCVAPPSEVYRLDDTKHRYFWAHLVPEAIPTFEQPLATKLLDAARFPGLWEHPLHEEFNTRALLSRGGLLLARNSGSSWYQDWPLNWETLRALRGYIDRYGLLLQAVETAPPPPPSYDDELEYE